MQVVAVIFFTLSVVYAGSGPYLPSGWKPSGPQFYLPGEVEKADDSYVKENIQEQSEASDSLREYGPPPLNEESQVQTRSQTLSEQALPDETTEKSFAPINLRNEQEVFEALYVTSKDETTEDIVTENLEVVIGDIEKGTTKEATTAENFATNESENIVEEIVTTTVTDTAENVATEAVTELVKAAVINLDNENTNSNGVSVFEERKGKSVNSAEEVEETLKSVQNFANAIIGLEKIMKTEQAQTAETSAYKTAEDIASLSQQDPKGFLEYGPPGFKEYGPPKELLKAETDEVDNTESNETRRRRRFSPKFRLPRRAL